MMMRMLEAGGIPPVIDRIRAPDEDNPAGYYEFEPVKQTRQDPSWVPAARGKAVKMVYQLLYDMPQDYSYKVLCMRRRMAELLASQRTMLSRSGRDAGPVDDARMGELFRMALAQFESWANEQPNVQLLNVDYNRIQENPYDELQRVNMFLDNRLDVPAMVAVLDKRLYRNRG
jgi:hypothetical protein